MPLTLPSAPSDPLDGVRVAVLHGRGLAAWATLPALLSGVQLRRPEQVRASYGSNLDRLRRLKTTYDPANVFRMNPNISPD